MDVFVALLRAVNVGGTGRLAMAELTSLCVAEGCGAVRTVGTSGNAVFRSTLEETQLGDRLRARLHAQTGRDVGVIIRRATEIDDVLACNPFPGADPARVMALFCDGAIPADPLAGATFHADEEVRAGPRALFVFYPSGAGASRLRLPVERIGTARNMNTVERIAAMARTVARAS